MSEESKSWYRMNRPLFNSGYENDEFWAYGQDGFQEVLDSFIGSDVLIYDKMISAEPQHVRAIIQNKTSDVFNSTTVRQILCNIGVLKCGQYVKHDGAIWLVSTLPDNNRIYEKAVLWKCKHTIRFLSPLTGEIVEYPVYSTNSTQYGTGEADKTQITVGDDQHLIYIPYNEETILLDNQFRFLMDKNRVHPTAYRITRVDPVSFAVGEERIEDGLIQWATIQDQFNEATDSADLMIADYFSKQFDERESVPGVDGELFVTASDGDFTLAIGDEKQLLVSYSNLDDLNGVLPEYRIEYDFSPDIATIVSDENGVITINAVDDRRNVGSKLIIRIVSDEVQSEATVAIQIVNW